MSKVSLDLKHFKHVKSDDKSTTLQHKDGHTLNIAHKSLSPEFQKQLQALTEAAKEPQKEVKSPKKEAEPKKMAEGGFLGDDSDEPNMSIDPELVAKAEAKAPPQLETPKIEDPLEEVKQQYNKNALEIEMANTQPMFPGVAGGMSIELPKFGPKGEAPQAGDVDPELWAKSKKDVQIRKEANDAAALQKAQADNEAIIKQNEVNKELGLPLKEVPGIPGQAAIDESQIQAQAEQPEAQPAEQPNEEPKGPKPMTSEEMMKSGYATQLAGLQQEMNAKLAESALKQNAYDKHLEAVQTLQTKFEEESKALADERQALMEDIRNNHINPDQYWDNHSRINAGIGMILAGFNPTNRPNAVIDSLDKEIDRNIRAQIENLGTKKSLLEANFRQFGNLKDAISMTKIMQTDMLSAQLERAASIAANPMAKANLLKSKGELQVKIAPEVQKLAEKRTLDNVNQLLASGEMKNAEAMIPILERIDPKRAKDLKDRLVTGLGLTNTPKGAEKIRELKASSDAAELGIKDLMALSKKPFKSWNLNDRAKADTIRGMLQGALRVLIVGPGAVSESERKLLQDIIADPTKIASLDSSNKARLETLSHSLKQKLYTAASAEGIRGLNAPKSSEESMSEKHAKALDFAKKNPNDPRSKEILRIHKDK